jgi:NAD(P)-dependent dehydrogenase (short-subunit alcohol dehydrogenase family)
LEVQRCGDRQSEAQASASARGSPNLSGRFVAQEVALRNSGGKIVLITGAAGDIGYGIAKAFLEQGAHVILTGLHRDRLEMRAAELPSRDRVNIIAADLAVPESVAALTASVVAAAGGVDVIINNAAIQHDGDVLDCSPDDFDHSFAVNLRAPYLLCRALVPTMRSRGGGAIVNIGSVHGTASGPRRLAYATMKAGLLGMTRSMAADLGPFGIRVNAVIPSATMTSQLREAWSRRRSSGSGIDPFQHAVSQHPLGRIAEVRDVVAAVTFLAEAEFVSGTEVRVDGGLLSSLRLLPAREEPS